MSHYKLIRHLDGVGEPSHSAGAYIVFEDDARCIRDWQNEVLKTLTALPDDWDILFFGGRPISYFHEFSGTKSGASNPSSLRHDICSGMFGKARGPLAPDGTRNISNCDPYWRASYLVHTHAYAINPRRIDRVLEVLEGKQGHESIDARFAKAMDSGMLAAYMTPENICEQSDLMSYYTPNWDGVTPQPWLGHFGFPPEAVKQHPGIHEAHMWGRILLDGDDSPACTGVY